MDNTSKYPLAKRLSNLENNKEGYHLSRDKYLQTHKL